MSIIMTIKLLFHLDVRGPKMLSIFGIITLKTARTPRLKKSSVGDKWSRPDEQGVEWYTIRKL